jgi:uncharacterized hydrophobic protein (TIGR00271 family)
MTGPGYINRLLGYITLENELDDFDKIHEAIEKEIIFKGTNLWILVFAIIIASIGLNVNSTAVIIGAMLISPLMGPINGMGYGIATYNFPLFKKALKNFSFAVIAGLLASTIYFTMSPLNTAHSELLARTSPSIYDVLIALFGGLAGIVAISSKLKGNVIPGVAIATALMPPLCTAGYGLATANFSYFFGAFYLFTINTVFIAISSVVISQILKFPIRTLVDSAQKKRVNNLISFVIVLVIIPSLYFGFKLVQKERFSDNASKFINNVSIIEGNFLLKHEVNPTSRSITLIYGGSNLSEEQKEEIIAKTKDFSIEGANIEFRQGLSFDEYANKKGEVDNLKVEVGRLNLIIKEQERELDAIRKKPTLGKQLLEEIQVIYPNIISCSYNEMVVFNDKDSIPQKEEIVFFKLANAEITDTDKQTIRSWINKRLNKPKVKVYFN